MKKLTYIITLLVSFTLLAQTGPGGVGITDGTSNLVLWLNADKTIGTDGTTITTWNDQSGYGYNFTGGNGAIFNNNVVNNYPAFTFNGTSNYFEKSFESTLNPNNLTIFAVDNVTSSNKYKAVFSNRDDPAGPSTKGFILYSRPYSNNWQYWTGTDSSWKVTDGNTSTAGSWSEQSISYEDSNNKKKLFINGSEKANNTHAMVLNTIRPFRIGAGRNERATPDYYFKGDISEIIMFDNVLTITKRIIVDNYLSAKYNYTLLANNIYTQDDSVNGDFDHNVAGIGQATDGSNHTDSQGTGIVRINNPSTLANDDFLFWGEETKNPTYNFTTSIEYTERLNSKWRVSKQNDLGTVSVNVKETDIDLSGKQSCAPLKLIVSNLADFSTKTSYNMTLTNGVFAATNVNFSDGDFFTFEFIDKIVVDSTQFYNGSGASNVPSVNDGCYKLLVKNTADGTLPLTENCIVREVEVENGGKLVVNTNLDFEITNNLQLDGEIRMIGDATLIQTHTGASQVTGNGKLYIDKTSNLTNVFQSGFWSSPVVTSGNTYTIASAMKDGTIPTSVNSSPIDITFVSGYDGATTTPISISKYWLAKLTNALAWDIHRNENTLYNPTEGYNMKSSGANHQNFTFVGKPNDGDYTSTITSGNSSLLGNPYPSPMDANEFLNSNNAIFNTLYFWDGVVDNSNSHVRSEYAGGYATYNGTTGVAYNGGETPNGIISVGQGFFVDATADGTIIFNNNHRIYDLSAPFFAKNRQFPILRLGVSFEIENNETFHRQLAIGFNGATNEFEEKYDAIMYDMHPSDFALKVLNNTNDFVITGIENYNENIEIPLHVKLDQQRNITFSIDAIENFSPNNIYLKDNITGLYHNLQSNVNLNLSQGDYTNRFSIVFRNSVASINDLINNNTVKVIDNGKDIFIESNITIKQVTIYNTLGQVLINKITNNTKINIPNQIDKGQIIFIKTVLINGQEFTKKTIKK